MDEYIRKDDILQMIESDSMWNLSFGILYDDIQNMPHADVAPVRPELRKAVKELHKQYERAINSPAVRNPLAWALCRTWKQMDGDDQKC